MLLICGNICNGERCIKRDIVTGSDKRSVGDRAEERERGRKREREGEKEGERGRERGRERERERGRERDGGNEKIDIEGKREGEKKRQRQLITDNHNDNLLIYLQCCTIGEANRRAPVK